MADITFFWLLTLVPSLPLLLVFWAFTRVLGSKKFEMEMLLRRGETLTKYLSAYGGTGKGTAQEQSPEKLIQSIVEQIFRLRYSFFEYLPAILFSVLVTSALTVLALSFAGIDLGLPSLLRVYLSGNSYLRDIVAGAIGALIWGIYELCERYRSGDLPPDAIFATGSRLLFVGAAGAIIGVVLNDRFAWTVAFGLGVLPVSAVRSFVVDRTRKALNLPSVSTIEAHPSFSAIQGWNTELSDKLARAGINSVQELACTNQFQLFLRSNLEWRVILDLSDQALLLLYIGDSIEKLRPLGIRSAVELAEIDWSRDDKEYFSGFSPAEAIQKISETLGLEQQGVRLLIRSISEDATVNFLGALWSDDTPDDSQDDGDEDDKDSSPAGKEADA